MTYFYSVISGVVSGIITSLLVFMFWQLQKPKLEISKEIAKNSKDEYRIKIVNKTKRYVSNVTILLQVVKRTNGINGDVYNTYSIPLQYPHIMSISPRINTDKSTDYAIRFVLPKNLEEHWNDDKYTYLKLIAHCSNAFGTVNKTFEQCYLRKSVIKAGEFECGDSMEIVAENHIE